MNHLSCLNEAGERLRKNERDPKLTGDIIEMLKEPNNNPRPAKFFEKQYPETEYPMRNLVKKLEDSQVKTSGLIYKAKEEIKKDNPTKTTYPMCM